MAIQGYGLFTYFVRSGHDPIEMGLRGSAGDVTRWRTRHTLARNFRGLHVEETSEQTLKGYNAFFQVFLTHSALELYLPLVGLDEESLEQALIPNDSEARIREFFRHDASGKLFEFLHKRLKHKNRAKLAACRDGTCSNVFYLSSSVRHIFAHGHLTANSNGIKPSQVAKSCLPISEFLLDFMETDFTCRIQQYQHKVKQEGAQQP